VDTEQVVGPAPPTAAGLETRLALLQSEC